VSSSCAPRSSFAAIDGVSAAPAFDAVNVGDALPPLALPPVSRVMLALYAGASGDHNPIHIDIDFARAAGMPDVFAHGMLSMAWLGRLLTNWAPQRDLREFSVRFSAMTHVGERMVATGRIVEKLERDGERVVRIALETANEAGEIKLSGEALVALS
jgi:acyl dehydratase